MSEECAEDTAVASHVGDHVRNGRVPVDSASKDNNFLGNCECELAPCVTSSNGRSVHAAACCLESPAVCLRPALVANNAKMEPTFAGGATAGCHNGSSPSVVPLALASGSGVAEKAFCGTVLIELVGCSHEAVQGPSNVSSAVDTNVSEFLEALALLESVSASTESKLVAFSFLKLSLMAGALVARKCRCSKDKSIWQECPEKAPSQMHCPKEQIP